MIVRLLAGTPAWVWLLLAALLWLGAAQSVARQVSVARATALPAALGVLSLAGVAITFHGAAIALAGWAAGLAMALTLGTPLVAPTGARRAAQGAGLHVPGSWVPMALLLALFGVKYGVGASLAFSPELARHSAFAAGIGFAYGSFSGLFLARAASLWRLARA